MRGWLILHRHESVQLLAAILVLRGRGGAYRVIGLSEVHDCFYCNGFLVKPGLVVSKLLDHVAASNIEPMPRDRGEA